ncbi:hypothetical protein QAD02_012955 [Eretmocerus hayati]|uniref:Uncharacterized protein n=1 Tax=Eretmocerus hayati TaxID=131215 RepID=A0ACC2P130_9HYME|nr:hypothetical protein QAD02_012955 [Eretmocerus hayati]
MANTDGIIQLFEDEVNEEFREFKRDPTFVQDKKRTVKLQRRIARLCRIIRSALVARALKKDSTGTIAALETKLHSATRIAAIVRRRKAKNRKSRVIFFEAESAFKKRYRTIVVGSVKHLEPKPFLVDAKPFIVTYIRNLLRIRDFGSLKAELIFYANFLLNNGKRSMKNFRVPYHNFLRTTHVGEWKKTSAKNQKTVRLLLLEQDSKSHYATIRDISRLISRQISAHKGKTYMYDTCQHCFNSQKKMERHTRDCAALNEQPIVLPGEDENILKFTEFYKKEPQPCIIYADVKCSLRPCNADDSSSDSESEEEEEQEGFEDLECEEVKDYDERYDLEEFYRKKKTNLERAAFQEHVPYGVGYYYLHRYDESKSHYKSHRSCNCVRDFAHDL